MQGAKPRSSNVIKAAVFVVVEDIAIGRIVGCKTMTHSLLHRRLIVVTGKGGVGKTTIAGAIGLLGARQGRNTLVLETTSAAPHLASLFRPSDDDCGPLSGSRKPSSGSHEPSSGSHEPPLESSPAASPDSRGQSPNGHGPSATGRRPPFDARRAAASGVPTLLAPNLWSATLDNDQALVEWMQSLGGRLPARRLAAKASFQYFAAAAPGAKELVSIVKVWRLAGGEEDTRDGAYDIDRNGREAVKQGGGDYDLVVLDAPATGHALAMLSSPQTFASIAKRGPIARQAERVRAMLADRDRTGYLAVAHASEMAVAETLELQAELRSQLDVELEGVIVNATLHRRFTREELDKIAALRAARSLPTHRAIAAAAAAAAEAAHARTRFQHSQVTRLRKHGLDVLQLPLVFQSKLDLAALEKIADRLDGML